MSFVRAPFAEMVVPGHPSHQTTSVALGHTGQHLYVSGVFIVVLELALVLENLLPILVVVVWLPASARGVGDRLVAAFSVTCILSALVPTPLGLASYFSGGWYGGTPTCTTYQVTSIWCNLSSLALLTCMCVNCHFAVWRLRKFKRSPQKYQRSVNAQEPLRNLPSSLAVSSNISASHHQDTTPNSSNYCNRPPSKKHSRKNTSKHHRIKNKQDAHISSKTVKFASENISNNKESKGPTDHDSEYLLHLQAKDSCLESSTGGNDAHIYGNMEISRPNVKQNIKKIDKERYIRLDDEYMERDKLDSTVSESRNFDISQKNVKCQFSCQPADLQTSSQNATVTYSHCISGCRKIGCATEYSPYDETNNRLRTSIDYTNNCSNDQILASAHSESCLCCTAYQSRDYVSLMLFLLFTCTLAISSLPVVGLGPRLSRSETSCRSWLVPIPVAAKERAFSVAFLLFIYTCLILGCSAGISVCMQVSRRMKDERKRKSRLYHEEENVPDLAELSVLDDMKRQYSLTCVVMAGLLTWLPVVVMLTLQKAGVQVSEATLMYSNIATSLPGLLNPLLYSLALARYRAGYKAILEKCCSRRRQTKCLHLTAGVNSQSNMAYSGTRTETTLDTSTTGHRCMHGRTNPNYESNLDVTIDEDDYDNDDDCFPDDSELLDDEMTDQTQKVSERTPLQAILVSVPPAGSFRTVLAGRTRSPWQRQDEPLSSSCTDKEHLLNSSCRFVDEETGL